MGLYCEKKLGHLSMILQNLLHWMSALSAIHVYTGFRGSYEDDLFVYAFISCGMLLRQVDLEIIPASNCNSRFHMCNKRTQGYQMCNKRTQGYQMCNKRTQGYQMCNKRTQGYQQRENCFGLALLCNRHVYGVSKVMKMQQASVWSIYKKL
ncbi:hypothetical protein CAPTEDRAFT_193657 [Capitella teleta]|uniref:Uncharacterized protein n=1 Tax=Capitella teleta TaxID=283909 RepID=R7URA3_CAPTE|nr:hypothetical protein CAPTEDRAFT_193657 [Capitella teleta]|eukprot:ELU08643.1 hypothetical protein CAPTEDRAFT_193657 [Capitella teleta]